MTAVVEGLGISREDWEATPESVQRLVVALLERIEKLEQEVADLKEKLGANSRNSSLPPSADRHRPMTRAERRRSERKRGGQPGHEGHRRELVPETEVDELIECPPPERCQDCGGSVYVDDSCAAERHQIWELPEVSARVTEYRLEWGQCIDCGSHFCGDLPLEVPEGMLGPRAMAAMAVLSGKYHLSKRATAEAMRDLFGLEMADGTVCNTEARVSAAIEPAVQEAACHVREQAVVHADETGWRLGARRAWLWTVVTATITVFAVRASRAAAVARELLGDEFRGILVSDRYSAYGWLTASRRQTCWAHLVRDFRRIAERGGQCTDIGDTLLYWAAEMFALWKLFRTDQIDRRALRRQMKPVRSMILETLELGADSAHPKTSATCQEILKLAPALWTFVAVDGVEPTNNAAERAIRPAVLWRKSSFGTDSQTGARFVERVLTVTATCRQQGRNVLEFLRQTIVAHLAQRPLPSLLPAA
jgi:transposase